MTSDFKVIYYKTSLGEIPAKDFIKSCPEKMQGKIELEIALLEKLGNEIGMPFSRHLEDGIFELRTKLATNITRILYFFVVGKRIVLTNGFAKKTQKTPRIEIEKAKKYRADFLQRDKEANDGKN